MDTGGTFYLNKDKCRDEKGSGRREGGKLLPERRVDVPDQSCAGGGQLRSPRRSRRSSAESRPKLEGSHRCGSLNHFSPCFRIGKVGLVLLRPCYK